MTATSRFVAVTGTHPPVRRSPCCAPVRSPSPARRRWPLPTGWRRPSSARAATSVVGLRQGDSGPAVQAVQQKLIGLGYYVADGATATSAPARPPRCACSSSRTVSTRPASSPRTRRAISGLPPASRRPPHRWRHHRRLASLLPRRLPPPGAVVGLRQGAYRRSGSPAAARHSRHRLVPRAAARTARSDPSTHRGVTLVQRVNGLPETGVVDARHGRRPRSDGERLLSVGSRSGRHRCPGRGDGAAVQRVQQLLIKSGVNVVGGADGVFGPQTRRSVARLPEAARAAGDWYRRRGDRRCAGQGRVAATAAAACRTHRRRTSDCASAPPGRRSPSCSRRSWPPGSSCAAVPTGSSASRRAPPCSIYQRVNGLSQTGIVDEATARLLGLLTAAPAAGGGSTSGGGVDGGGLRRATTSAAPVSSRCRRR